MESIQSKRGRGLKLQAESLKQSKSLLFGWVFAETSGFLHSPRLTKPLVLHWVEQCHPESTSTRTGQRDPVQNRILQMRGAKDLQVKSPGFRVSLKSARETRGEDENTDRGEGRPRDHEAETGVMRPQTRATGSWRRWAAAFRGSEARRHLTASPRCLQN